MSMARKKVKAKPKRKVGPGALSFLINSFQGFILLILIMAALVTAAMKYKHEIKGFISDQVEQIENNKKYTDTSKIAQLSYQTAIRKMNSGQYSEAVKELKEYEFIPKEDRSPKVDDLAAKAKAMCSRIDNAWDNIYTTKQIDAAKIKDIHFDNGFIIRAEYEESNGKKQIKTPLGLVVNLDDGYSVKDLDRNGFETDMKETLAEEKLALEKQSQLDSKDYTLLAKYAREQSLLSQAGPLLDQAISLDKSAGKKLKSSASENYIDTGLWYASVNQIGVAKSFFERVVKKYKDSEEAKLSENLLAYTEKIEMELPKVEIEETIYIKATELPKPPTPVAVVIEPPKPTPKTPTPTPRILTDEEIIEDVIRGFHNAGDNKKARKYTINSMTSLMYSRFSKKGRVSKIKEIKVKGKKADAIYEVNVPQRGVMDIEIELKKTSKGWLIDY